MVFEWIILPCHEKHHEESRSVCEFRFSFTIIQTTDLTQPRFSLLPNKLLLIGLPKVKYRQREKMKLKKAGLAQKEALKYPSKTGD